MSKVMQSGQVQLGFKHHSTPDSQPTKLFWEGPGLPEDNKNQDPKPSFHRQEGAPWDWFMTHVCMKDNVPQGGWGWIDRLGSSLQPRPER